MITFSGGVASFRGTNPTIGGTGYLQIDGADILDEATGVPTNLAGHLITGDGEILKDSGGMINQGTIQSVAVTGLTIDPGAEGFVNKGTLRAQVGTLTLEGSGDAYTNLGTMQEVSNFVNNANILQTCNGTLLPDAASIGGQITDACASLPSGAISWYKFEGDFTDSVDGNDATETQGDVNLVPGYVNGGVSFDGTSDFMRVATPTNLDLKEFAVEMWFKVNGLPEDPTTLVEKQDNFKIFIDQGTGILSASSSVDGTTQTMSSGVNVNDGNWHHVAYLAHAFEDCTDLILWVDGVFIGASCFDGEVDTPSADLFIGNGIDGLIDELTIYNNHRVESHVVEINGAGTFGKAGSAKPVNTATGGTTIVTASKGEITSINALSEAAVDALGTTNKPTNVSFEDGFYDWTVTGLDNGETITMSFELEFDLPTGVQYWKVDSGGVWTDLSANLAGTLDDNRYELTVTDGGAGDGDLSVNGQITDPGGLGSPSGTLVIEKITNGGNAVFDFETNQEVGMPDNFAIDTSATNTWAPQSSGTSQFLWAVSAVDENIVWTVGNGGTILRTMDGGTTWSTIPSGTTDNLYDVTAVDVNTVWVVGSDDAGNARILKTSNGAASNPNDVAWTGQTSPISVNLRAVSAVDDQIAWASGDTLGIIKTIDGGANWVAQTTPYFEIWWGIEAVNDYTAWAAGSGDTIIRTELDDAQDVWFAQATGTSGVTFTEVSALDDQTAWAVGGSGTILKTTNGGGNWVAQTSGTGAQITSVSVVDANTVWATAGFSILYTTDGGANWNTQYTDSENTYYDVSAADTNTAWGAGSGGNLDKSGNHAIFQVLDGIEYAVNEILPAGWTLNSAVCSNGDFPTSITVSPGETVTCAYTNTETSTLQITKTLDNTGGGTAVEDDFIYRINQTPTLYAAVISDDGNYLSRVNPATGIASIAGELSVKIDALAFEPESGTGQST